MLFIWRVMHHAIPTFSVLRHHHLPIRGGCLFCSEEVDSPDHVLLHCPFARVVWFALPGGFLVDKSRFQSVRAWLLFWCSSSCRSLESYQDIWFSVICTLYAIWQVRNSCLWKPRQGSPSVSEVVILSQNLSRGLKDPACL